MRKKKKEQEIFFRIKKSVDKRLKNKVSYAFGSEILNLYKEHDLFLFTRLLILNIGNFVKTNFK